MSALFSELSILPLNVQLNYGILKWGVEQDGFRRTRRYLEYSGKLFAVSRKPVPEDFRIVEVEAIIREKFNVARE